MLARMRVQALQMKWRLRESGLQLQNTLRFDIGNHDWVTSAKNNRPIWEIPHSRCDIFSFWSQPMIFTTCVIEKRRHKRKWQTLMENVIFRWTLHVFPQTWNSEHSRNTALSQKIVLSSVGYLFQLALSFHNKMTSYQGKSREFFKSINIFPNFYEQF